MWALNVNSFRIKDWGHGSKHARKRNTSSIVHLVVITIVLVRNYACATPRRGLTGPLMRSAIVGSSRTSQRQTLEQIEYWRSADFGLWKEAGGNGNHSPVRNRGYGRGRVA